MTLSIYTAAYIHPPTVDGPGDIEIVVPGLVPYFAPLEVIDITVYAHSIGTILSLQTIYMSVVVPRLLMPPPLPRPEVDFDALPEYGEQEPQSADPTSPPPEFGIEPVPTERWYPDDQYRT